MPERVYVALDLETTGLDANQDAIIEIGAVKFTDNQVIARFATLVNPLRPIPARITQITGIRDADVAAAPTLDRVLPELRAFVGSEVSAVIAHNTAFDLGFLRAAGVHFQRAAYDTVELATILLPEATSYNLGELCLRLGIPLVDAHRAPDDAEATGHLFRLLRCQMLALPAPVLRLIADSAEGSTWSLTSFFADGGAQADAGAPLAAAVAPPVPLLPASEFGAADEDQRTVAVSPHLIEEIFAEGGPLQTMLGPTFERRAGQLSMALQVTDAFSHGDHLLVEAGTGTGKSLAYLLPAALWAIANDARVVIATNTINLQEQLLDKDIPQVAALLAGRGLPPLRAALLKGRQHYLCTRRFHEWRTSHRLSPVELTVLAKVLVWLPTTQTGEDSELTFFSDAERAIWRRLCSDGGACSLERCGRSYGAAFELPDADFYLQARRRSEQAHLVVVNHALLLADLASEGRILPPYTHLVVDETHRLEEAATDQLTFRVTWPELRYTLARVSAEGDLLGLLHRVAADRRHHAVLELLPEVAGQARRCEQRLREFADLLAMFARAHEQARSDAGYLQRLALDGSARSQPMWSRVEIEWDDASRSLRVLLERLTAVANQMEQAQWREDERTVQLFYEWRGVIEQLAEVSKRLDEIILAPHGTDRKHVAWLEVGAAERDGAEVGATVAMAPLSVQHMIEEGLVRQRGSAVFTGATLRIGANFSYLRDRLGLWDVKVSTVDSPFDYKRNVLLYLPNDMPLPNDGRYQQAVEQAVLAAASACQGRTLALFTSYQQVRSTADVIRTPLERLGVAVLQHGQSSRSRLLREFRASEQAILLGTRSFWEGVDLPGDEVRCLLIARLPFAVPSDPMVAARSSEFDDAFNEYMVPDAVLRFRQGFGRLIRRAGDRGVVVVLDSRVWRKAYGQTFLDALPECTTRRAPLSNLAGAIEKWFAR
ncbi:helicase C-terminal domain-containing protein [Caldilinea sp.]|uniref:helicase C-terminal domain-containing protein n=1 Tax=Caldilinea sp. TaxID=2293560 RepID=UPI002D067270|nr:helicase C-terminal domain-containing protein [Caldilinea sp.]